MLYQNLTFPKRKDRPFFYTSFVATIDGKVAVKKKGYWPIGSKNDFAVFTLLRAHADVIIDGKNTALSFGAKTIETIQSDSFRKLRRSLGKEDDVRYFVVTAHPDEKLKEALKNPHNFKPEIFTGGVDDLSQHLQKESLMYVFIDGGPHLVGSLLVQNSLDEIFLTIAPKIFGNDKENTLTMAEGQLFSPEEIKTFTLVSVDRIENEAFLRYRRQ